MTQITLSHEIVSALEAGRLAPSAHNTQPWKFRPHGRTIEIGWDRAHELPAGDPDSRYLITCLGAAAESMAIGASRAGYEASVSYAGPAAPELAATVVVTGAPARPADQELADALEQRQTSRLPFSAEPVPSRMLDALIAEAGSYGCCLSFLTESASIRNVAETIGDATARNLDRRDVYSEFYSWVRLSRDDPGFHRDGLSLDSLAPSWLYRHMAPCVMPPRRMAFATRIGLHRLIANSQRDLARDCPVFGLITAPGPRLSDFFIGGRAMVRVWLRAAALGLNIHPMTAAMDNPETRSELGSIFGVPADAPMVVSFRLGYGPNSPRSARLPLDELISAGTSE